MSAPTPKNQPFQPVRTDVQFAKLEEEILAFWEKEKIFEKSVNEGGQKGTYTFYDGPPFATGLPHYGHILAGTLKDIVPRYWTMKGFRVDRRFGWDCHGLPVEYEINKSLKLESRKDILAFGVDKYNQACRSIVQRYSNEWKQTVKRVGRWVDMENAYFTMDVSFMQSVWWVFQEMWKKGLIYEGYKVVPYSTGLSTALSNFEANLNYKDVQDPAITVSFPVVGEANLHFLAWTTTPWTLPSNLALAVGKDLDYVRVKHHESGKEFVLAEALLPAVFKNPAQDVQILETAKGLRWVGTSYVPLFDYFRAHEKDGAFKVIHADHVTTESGTGIVHMAPAFGEEDYYACMREKIPVVNPVDDDGVFTDKVTDYAGRKVKDADKDIIAELKKRGRLYKQDTIVHSYPFCWRTETPLIYRAVSSWFVAVEKIKDTVVASNKTTHWVPEHLRDGRFGNWLENARDWAISRNRFWGTPLPIWRNKEGEILCVGSAAELEKLSGQKVTDLHMEFIDKITIPSPTGKSPLKRIDAVLDCWFESGSMPYAQWGYPFENKAEFDRNFPAQFIAEGLDQTRGWFYTLMVIGSALFGKAPFKNVVVNGLILAEDGKKMSKSLRNYPDPREVLDQHGADALRLYMINSPVVKAQELRFSENGVREVVRQILLRWWNSYAFFVSYANIDQFTPKGDAEKSPNLLDQWILSRLNSLIQLTEREMEQYHLYAVVPVLLQFVEELTNTYIRFNRPHFWENGMTETKRYAFETLHHVLVTLSKVAAPFAPFMSEAIYRNLASGVAGEKQSVHLAAFPTANAKLIKPELEQAVELMDKLVMLGRNLREKMAVKAKIPLKDMKIIHREEKVLKTLATLQPYFQEELNVRKIDYVSDEENYVQVTVKPNFPVLGKRFGAKMKQVAAQIGKLSLTDIVKLEGGGTLQIEGQDVGLAELEIRRAVRGDRPYLATDRLISIEMNPDVGEEQIREGLAREIIRKVQAARKNAKFNLDDRIRLELKCEGKLFEAAKAFESLLREETLTREFALSDAAAPVGSFTETVALEEGELHIGVKVLA